MELKDWHKKYYERVLSLGTNLLKRHKNGYWILYNEDGSLNSVFGDEYLEKLLDVKTDEQPSLKIKPKQQKTWYRKGRW